MKKIKTNILVPSIYMLLTTISLVSLACAVNYSLVSVEQFFKPVTVLLTLPWSFIAFMVLYPKLSSGSEWLAVFCISAITNATLLYFIGSLIGEYQNSYRR